MSSTSDSAAADGHHDLVGQPHDEQREGPLAHAEAEAARISEPGAPLGALGPRFDRRSPFLIGLAAAAGVAVTYGLVLVLADLRGVLIVIGLALFLAIGIEPLVSWLVNRRFPRWLAVTAVFLAGFGVVGGFLAVAIPVLVEQGVQFAERAPAYLRQAVAEHSWLARLNERVELRQVLEQVLSGSAGLVQAGLAVFSTLTDLVILLVLTVYFTVELPRVRAGLYRFVPHSRRPRTILISDQICVKVGGYVLGNLLVSLVCGVLTLIWLLVFNVPYALLLALTVALLDLIPVVGSIAGGVLISLVALTVSVPVGLATVGFVIAYRLVEDYLLIPKIIGRTVRVPALVTVVAVVLGGALLGVVGALVAIPVAAALLLITQEVVYPRLDRT
ncbi:AI-2E family transporter [Crossiella sp. NPDC003009]